MEAIKSIFFSVQNWWHPKSDGKNQLNQFSDIFECAKSEPAVTLVPKKLPQVLANMQALAVNDSTSCNIP